MRRLWMGPLCLLFCSVLALPGAASAARPPKEAAAKPRQAAAGAKEKEAPAKAAEKPYKGAILIEAESGQVLEEDNADERLIPASIVKMMVMLIVAEAVQKGVHKLDEMVNTSALASKIGGSQVYLKQGERFTLEEMLKAISIASANDASYAVAEHMTGSVEAFVQLMNQRAKQLGMANTLYHSVHGLPPGPGEEADYTTARDTAILAREIVKHSALLKWTSTWREPFRDGKFILLNTNNRLLRTFRGMDGIKTGYYGEAGFNLCATAKREGMRLVSVVLGATTRPIRDRESSRLLLQGFRLYKKENLFVKVKELEKPVAVAGAKKPATLLAPAAPVSVLVKRLEAPDVKTRLRLPSPLAAPLAKGQKVGELEAVLGDKVIAKTPVVATEDVAQKTLLDRVMFWK
ncbi:MAG: D-alanyl-D-alanine carboxypeptidase [Candidatus Tectomicrobia bacterium]|uniref:serine-type D-Ala-D-Ala carboxypeptidase n=1 Tax=Tectimicrobiota bacterium TaxID=2528274 RepID=A0A932I0Y9_UNCTE|nr:D-alanyl-D-alanine carboxypeptidase [Candidatus Tectomicrobia bacterium]